MKKQNRDTTEQKPQLVAKHTRKSLAPDKAMFTRVLLILALVVVIVLPYLLYKLAEVQIINQSEYEADALSQQTRSVTLLPNRGIIYDSEMNEVAVSSMVEHVCFAPANMRDEDKSEEKKAENEQEIKDLCRFLADLLDKDYDTLYGKTLKTESYYQVVEKNLDKTVTDQIRTYIREHGISGVDFYPSSERYYPYGNFAASVIGFTDADGEGLYGVERTYDVILSGQAGRVITARNRKGESMPFAYEQYLDAEDGSGVVLTVNHDVQDILMKYLESATADNLAAGATGIVMRISDGAIMAMGHYPDYDLNDPRALSEAEEAEILLLPEDEQSNARTEAQLNQWKNQITGEAYEPGSTFKIITAAMALEEDVASENDSFYCADYTHVAGWNISCWKHGGHGSLNFTGGVMGSCNCVFMEVAKRIGCDSFYKYMGMFGLLSKTNVDLPGESKGIFFSEESFDDNESNIAVSSFGQRFKVTPLQLITAVCGIANGGNMMQPHVVSAYTDADGNITQTVEPTVIRQIVSRNTSERLCNILEQVVSKGTGRNAYVAGYRVGGKTGTSEKFDAGHNVYIASFMGIAPCDDPQYACLILIDEPKGDLYQGGQITAPVVGSVFSEILPVLGVDAVYTDEELETLQVTVPKMTHVTLDEAKSRAEKARVTVEVVGEGSIVTAQVPAYGSKISSKTPVILYCGEAVPEEKTTVPSVVGLGYSAAVQRLQEAGLYMNASGAVQTVVGSSVRARKQDVEEGTEVTKGSVITVDFLDGNTYNTGE